MVDRCPRSLRTISSDRRLVLPSCLTPTIVTRHTYERLFHNNVKKISSLIKLSIFSHFFFFLISCAPINLLFLIPTQKKMQRLCTVMEIQIVIRCTEETSGFCSPSHFPPIPSSHSFEDRKWKRRENCRKTCRIHGKPWKNFGKYFPTKKKNKESKTKRLPWMKILWKCHTFLIWKRKNEKKKSDRAPSRFIKWTLNRVYIIGKVENRQ